MMQTIDQALDKLEHSKFRSSFHLTKKEQLYLEDKGMTVMRHHAEDFVRQKLAPADPFNDGKQTPMQGIPYLRQCMQRLVAAVDVSINGTRFRYTGNCRIMSRKES